MATVQVVVPSSDSDDDNDDREEKEETSLYVYTVSIFIGDICALNVNPAES